MQQYRNTTQRVISVKSYVFQVQLEQEEDGRWSAWVDALPGCATWGYTNEEALHNIRDGVEAYISAMQKAGQEVPTDATIQVLNAPVVAVTV